MLDTGSLTAVLAKTYCCLRFTIQPRLGVTKVNHETGELAGERVARLKKLGKDKLTCFLKVANAEVCNLQTLSTLESTSGP